MANVSLVKAEGLTLYSSLEGRVLLQGVSWEIAWGERVALIGKSGSGKTLMALTLLGLLPPKVSLVSGRIWLGERLAPPLGSSKWNSLRGRFVTYLSQDPATFLHPTLRLGSQIGRVLRKHFPRETRNTVLEKTLELLSRCGFSDPEKISAAYPFELSGGMQQRGALALVLACAPRFLIADELTSHLDRKLALEVLRVLSEYQKETGMALLWISHDLDLVEEHAHRVMVLESGRIVESGNTEEVFLAPQHSCTQYLVKECREFLEGGASVC